MTMYKGISKYLDCGSLRAVKASIPSEIVVAIVDHTLLILQ